MPDEGSARGALSRLKTLLQTRRLPLIAAVLSVVLSLPAIDVGWIIDDYYHRAVLLERPKFRAIVGSPSEMFRFFRGDPERTRKAMDLGLFPWWTDPYVKAEFLQALTVLTHRFDYALWPDSPRLMHAHNLFWLGTAVAAVAAFYRRMLGATWVAGAAALLFALDDARGATAGFIANRNVLIAATFGVSALILHDRWRRDGSRLSALLAPVLLSGALFAKEEGIGTCAYLASYGLFADRAGRWRGLLALLPYAVVVVTWRALRASWGYGVGHLGLYIDPLSEPDRFALAAVERAPILLLGQWTPFFADYVIVFRGPAFPILLGVAIAFLGLLLFTMAPLLRRDRLARFWAAGMLFATVPVCATLPMDRLLTFVGIGAFGLLAQFWAFVFGDRGDRPSSRWWIVPAKVMAGFLVVVHAILGPITLVYRAGNPLGPAWVEHRLYVGTPLGADVGDRTLVIVNAPSPVHASYLIFREELSGRPVPKYTRALAPMMPRVTIRRIDTQTLEIRPTRGYLDMVLDQVFRNERHPLALGERVELPGMTAKVVSLTSDGRPATVAFRFDVPLESPTLRWLCFRGNRFEPFTPPAVGQEIEIPFDWRTFLMPDWLSRRSAY
jgi:hypothetical protein